MLDEQLTIDSGPARAPHPVRHLGAWCSPRFLGGLLLGIVAVEAGIRVLELRTGNLAADVGTGAIHAAALSDPAEDFDLLAVGSSSAGADILMPQLEASGAACDGYVAWLPATTISEIAAFTAEHVQARQTPRQLLVALTMREFVPPGDAPTATHQLDESDQSPAMEWAERHVGMIRGRDTLQDPYRLGSAIQGTLDEPLTADGNQLIMRDRLIANESLQHRRQEELVMADYRFSPAAYGALRALLETATAAGMTPIVANLPVNDLFIDLAPGGRQDYDEYVAAIASASADAGVEFIDLGTTELDQALDYADVNHLNASGARQLTEELDARLVNRCGPARS